MKTENMLMTHKLPLMEKLTHGKAMYGQLIEKLSKDVKAKKDEIDVLGKMTQVKMH